MIRKLKTDQLKDIRPLIRSSNALFDGQFNMDVSQDILAEKYERDLKNKLSNFSYGALVLTDEAETKALLLWRHLEWDSNHFGIPMERIDCLIGKSPVHLKSLINRYLQEASKRGVRHISVRLPTTDFISLSVLGHCGFEFMDGKVLMRRDTRQAGPEESLSEVSLEPVSEDDIETLLKLAGVVMEQNRFSRDCHLDKDLTPFVYSSWLKMLIDSQPENILVAKKAGKVHGFVATTVGIEIYGDFEPETINHGFVSLVGVDKDSRGLGIGKFLMHHGVERLKRAGCQIVYANTSHINTGSMLAFQRAGFEVFSTLSEMRLWQ